MSLCLAAGGLVVALGTGELTLEWRHSVEKTLWQELWREEAGGLRLAEARIQGSGAGMDPPPEARLVAGFWRWRPDLPALPDVAMRRSGATADWRLCRDGTCRPMAELVPADADPVILKVCP